jgi:hypothetical protein
MLDEGSAEDSQQRVKKLRRYASRIIRKMDEHQLFGFILVHGGKKAIPKLVKLWGEPPKPRKEDEPEEGPEEKPEEKPSEPKKEEESTEDLIELVMSKPK